MRPGDTLGFSAWSRLGVGINLCTFGIPFWCLSHIAGVVRVPGVSRLLVCESTTQYHAPCVLCGKVHDGVQFHYVPERVRSYRGLVWRYPLSKPLTVHESRLLGNWCASQHGKTYDYIGAFRSRETLVACLLRKDEDLNSMFCSELWTAGLREVRRVRTENASAWSPNLLGRYLVRHRVCKRPETLKGKPCPSDGGAK